VICGQCCRLWTIVGQEASQLLVDYCGRTGVSAAVGRCGWTMPYDTRRDWRRRLRVDDVPMTRADAPRERWRPAGPSEVAALLRAVSAPWWIAGGYAIELAVGRSLRPHADIDVLLLRCHQMAIQQALAGWDWWAVDPPGMLRSWDAGESLAAHVHDAWCRPAPDRPWRIQAMLDESAGPDRVSRRNPGIRRPVAQLGMVSAEGIPYLAPEVQLFYEAKHPRPQGRDRLRRRPAAAHTRPAAVAGPGTGPRLRLAPVASPAAMKPGCDEMACPRAPGTPRRCLTRRSRDCTVGA
jgi:hypothetical protein